MGKRGLGFTPVNLNLHGQLLIKTFEAAVIADYNAREFHAQSPVRGSKALTEVSRGLLVDLRKKFDTQRFCIMDMIDVGLKIEGVEAKLVDLKKHPSLNAPGRSGMK